MLRLEAIINALHKSALGGSVFAQREALTMLQELEVREEVRRELAAELERRVLERICAWKRERAAVWREALARDAEPDQPWPHPDDVLVDRQTGKWSLRGPMKPIHVPEFEHYRAERDWNIAALVNLDKAKLAPSSYEMQTFAHRFAWRAMDALLPLRWQLTDPQYIRRFMSLAMLTQKQRTRELERLDALRQQLMPIRSKAEELQTEREVSRLMRPLLRHFGVRSVKELERLEG